MRYNLNPINEWYKLYNKKLRHKWIIEKGI